MFARHDAPERRREGARDRGAELAWGGQVPKDADEADHCPEYPDGRGEATHVLKELDPDFVSESACR